MPNVTNEELQWIVPAIILAVGFLFFWWIDHCGRKVKEAKEEFDATYSVSAGYEKFYWRRYKKKK
jgi:hypothetical protein